MLNEEQLKKLSKAMSYWLRHKPEDIGLNLSKDGWVDTQELIDKGQKKMMFDFNDVKQVVQQNDKQRFAMSGDFLKIRANQGHSIEVKIEFQEILPPVFLYHGTPNKSVDQILKEGLKKMKRTHVHLSVDKETAAKVGSRRGDFTILKVEAMKMRAEGYKIYISENGVYLTDVVPPEYISL
jgi:putative RNA 2'-phosphotransferase